MAQKCTVEGVAYEIKGGRTLVNGVGYAITKGRTLVDGVGYDVSFAPAAALPTFDGSCNFYGDATKGWVELLEDGTLTFPNTANLASCDVYLLENGENGYSGLVGPPLGRHGGKGGDHAEMYRLDLRGMEADVTIGEVTKFPLSDGTIYDTADAANGSAGGTSTARDGADGYSPFGGTMVGLDGMASRRLGAGGGFAGHAGGHYGGGAGGTGSNGAGKAGLANTGSGGGGGAQLGRGGVGGTGIVIVRWGYETA